MALISIHASAAAVTRKRPAKETKADVLSNLLKDIDAQLNALQKQRARIAAQLNASADSEKAKAARQARAYTKDFTFLVTNRALNSSKILKSYKTLTVALKNVRGEGSTIHAVKDGRKTLLGSRTKSSRSGLGVQIGYTGYTFVWKSKELRKKFTGM